MTADIITETAVPLAELANSWFIALRAERLSPATVKAYRRGVEGFIGWHEREFPAAVPVLEAKIVRLYLSDLHSAGQAPGTVRLRYSALKLFGRWLLAEGELAADPLGTVKPPKLDKPSVEYVSDPEIDALLKACQGKSFADRRDTALVMLMISTGIRAGEAVALTVDDVDLRGEIVHVRHGKGDKARDVPLLPAVAAAIDRYLRARRGHKLAHTSPLLWLGEMSRPFGYQGAARALGLRAQAAGIEGFHLHRMRHSFASRWMASGGSEDGLMAVAGWSDRNMVQRYAASDRSKRALEEAKHLRLDRF
jgi:site-specific recombinase XerD